MEFRILGPLEVVDDGGQPVPLGGARQRALLAALLLHANEVVLTDRLVEDLWRGNPPTSGTKALQVAVSQLRKTIGDGFVETHPAGYLLRFAPDQLDFARFERMRERARDAIGSGRPADAADALHEALELWRGPALGDVAYEVFARAEAERLEELRLVALEERIEADLALGRHAGLVAELEALAAKHPLRERLREHLMVALYRSGRQAEALEVYRETRRMLADELGIEPGRTLQNLERAVLRHDPQLDSNSPRHRSPGAPARASRRLGRLGAAAAVAAVAIATALVLAFGRADTLASVSPNSVAVIDPDENALVDEVAVGDSPGPVIAGSQAVWVLNRNSHTLSKIDPRSRKVVYTLGIPQFRPNRLVLGPGGVIVTGLSPGAELTFVEPARPAIRSGFLVERPEAIRDLAGSGIDLWVVSNVPELLRIRRDAEVTSIVRIPLPRPGTAVAPAGEFVWVTHDDATVTLVDSVRREVAAVVRVGRHPVDVAVGAGAVWVANGGDGTVTRIRARPAVREATIRVGRDPAGLVVAKGAVWVVNRGDGSVSRIDPRTNRVVATIEVGERPEGVAVAGGLVWVSVREK